MSSPSDTVPSAAAAQTRPALSPLAGFTWSVRREIWEHRALYLAPLSVAGLMAFAALVSAVKLGGHVHFSAEELPADKAAAIRLGGFFISSIAIIIVAFIVAVFYCLSALNTERRDRSILFWKSLPVSDLTTVLAKAAIPMAVLPVFVFVLVIVLQGALLIFGALGMLVSGGAPGLMAADLHLPQMWTLLLYGLAVTTLWYAPLYAWCLMVSAWSKRAPFLWAVLPPLALALVERLALGTSVVGALLHDRIGGFNVGFKDGGISRKGALDTMDPLSLMDPAALVASPGLWGGLVAAALFLAAAVWLRRTRDPI